MVYLPNVPASFWFADTAATHRVTPNMASLHHSGDYIGQDHLQFGDGKALHILHTDISTILMNTHPLLFYNISHVPGIMKPLLSISQFASDNNVLFKFYPAYLENTTHDEE